MEASRASAAAMSRRPRVGRWLSSETSPSRSSVAAIPGRSPASHRSVRLWRNNDSDLASCPCRVRARRGRPSTSRCSRYRRVRAGWPAPPRRPTGSFVVAVTGERAEVGQGEGGHALLADFRAFQTAMEIGIGRDRVALLALDEAEVGEGVRLAPAVSERAKGVGALVEEPSCVFGAPLGGGQHPEVHGQAGCLALVTEVVLPARGFARGAAERRSGRPGRTPSLPTQASPRARTAG